MPHGVLTCISGPIVNACKFISNGREKFYTCHSKETELTDTKTLILTQTRGSSIILCHWVAAIESGSYYFLCTPTELPKRRSEHNCPQINFADLSGKIAGYYSAHWVKIYISFSQYLCSQPRKHWSKKKVTLKSETHEEIYNDK